MSTQCGGVPHICCVVTVPQASQALEMQLAVLAHCVLHVPQLAVLLVRSTQTALAPVPHTFCPVGQMHALLTHIAPIGQAIPQPPQLFWSLVV